jgi:hypothetical protein
MNEADIPHNAVILNPAHSYRRAPPALAGCWCPDANLLAYFYDNIRQRDPQCPAEYMIQFDAAHVMGAQFILGPDRQWFAPSITDYPPAEGMRASIEMRIGIGSVDTLPSSDKPTVVIAKAGANNYGHTLTEILPRLINLARSPLRDVRLLLPNGMAGFEPTLHSLLGLLGIAADLVFVDEKQVTSVGNLVYIGPVSQHNRRKSQTVLAFRDLMWRSLAITPQPHRRLYIERPPSEQRGLVNAPEARAVLEAAGYETVHPATLPFNDQVALFSQASHIVGTLGAGLTNVLFAPPSCRVVMIDNGLADYFFWDLAALAGQPFTWMFTGPISFFSHELARALYAVDLDGLRYVLHQAG